jgi:CRISPR system Cascade subunit CasD
MTVLMLRLAAPLQSWGTSSKFVRRNTDRVPSRSGIIGLLAAAKGRRRTDSIEDLLGLRIGVRVEQAGQIERDFHTARTRDGAVSMPLSYRFYLADAAFLAAVEGPASSLEELWDALRRPVFPLYLGRRSCPPAGQLALGMRPGDLYTALREEPWQASPFVRRRHRRATVQLDTVTDWLLAGEADTDPDHTAHGDDLNCEVVRDDPISFDPRYRQYGWRTVVHRAVVVPNPDYVTPNPASSLDHHQPFDALDEDD